MLSDCKNNLLRENTFSNLKVEPMLMYICPYFHNKPKQLKYLQ